MVVFAYWARQVWSLSPCSWREGYGKLHPRERNSADETPQDQTKYVLLLHAVLSRGLCNSRSVGVGAIAELRGVGFGKSEAPLFGGIGSK